MHLVPTGSRRYRDELAFRDLLRARPDLAGEYVALKRRLAGSCKNDREAYTEGKAPFIVEALNAARGGPGGLCGFSAS